MNVLVLLATLSLGTSLRAASQESMTLGSLTRARAVFDRIDDDGDESLSVDEATLVGIPEEHFHGEDADGDECFSRDEFSVYYYHLLVAAAEDVEADLVDEVAHLQALKLARQPQVTELKRSEPAPKPAPRHKADSLTRARKLLVRLNAQAAFSKSVTHDFRSFFWSRDPRGIDLERSVPALVRVNMEIDGMLESAFVTETEARLLRKTLVNRAGPAAARAAMEADGAVVEVHAVEPGSAADGQRSVPSSDEARASVPVSIPDIEVTRLETWSTGEPAAARVDADFIGPLEVGAVRTDRREAALATALPFFLRLAFPADVAGFSSFMVGPDAGGAPPMDSESLEPEVEASPVEEMSPVEPTSASTVDSVDDQEADDQVTDQATLSSVPIALPTVQVQVEQVEIEQQSTDSAGETTELPFFIPATLPVVYSGSDCSLAPGSPTGRPETR